MAKSLSPEESFEDVFRNTFPDLTYVHHIEDIGGKVNVFFIGLDDEKTLDIFWDKIRNLIAVYYQSKLESDFERWNIYIVFVLPIIVGNELKYKIENDQLSSRKIIVDDFVEEFNEEAKNKLLSCYIKNELSLPDTDNDHDNRLSTYTSNSKVFSVVNAIAKSGKGKAQLELVYGQILKKLRNENSEG